MAAITGFLVFSYLFMAVVLIPIPIHSQLTDAITPGQNLTDSEQLVSANGLFTLGFFSPDKSNHRYLGIWYTKDEARRVVWVANRLTPIINASGVLKIGNDGRLKIKHSGGLPIVLNSDQAAKHNATATLLDSGNLLLTHMITDMGGAFKRETVWESFDYPSDTLLPGMRLGVNLKDGTNRSLTSWLSHEVPAPGAFTLGLNPTVNGSCQLVIWRRGVVFWTSDVWRNKSIDFKGWWSTFNVSFTCDAVSKYEKYVMYTFSDHYHLSRFMMGAWRQIKINSFPEFEITLCEDSNRYPVLGSECVEEEPKCGRHHRSGFKFIKGFMGRRAEYSDHDPNLGLSDCDVKCRDNCSCIAYASAHKNGTGCLFWLQKSPSVEGGPILWFDAYVLPQQLKKGNWIYYTAAIICVQTILCCSICCSSAKSKIAPGDKIFQDDFIHELGTHGSSTPERLSKKCSELQFFSFFDIKVATNNFSSENKLGQGGFGPVYMGKLSEGQEIAVKRLSRCSLQGLLEFKNEIVLISKLQHTNLVKLLGYCIDGEEKMLIYEYMSNKSLDFFIFDRIRKEMLDWQKRFSIIEGIAQGLLYLHKYSRLRVIHRDLKASNILLDNDMNPKISDFGMAKIFRQDESRANTNRVVGTFGYMSPEYAMEGIFSMKSDVFSFGVVLLEIISGRKNTSFDQSQQHINLIGYAWKLWKEGKILELIDSKTCGTFSGDHMQRCIHVAFLCVQENPIDRPTMSNVVFMLRNETTVPLPTPKRPAFSFESGEIEANWNHGVLEDHSSNTLSMSI